MRVEYCRKTAPMTIFCRRDGKPRQVRPTRRYTKQQNLIVQVLTSSSNCRVPPFTRSLPKYPAKNGTLQEYLHRLAHWWPGKRNWWDSARPEPQSNQTKRLCKLWNNFQRSLVSTIWRSCFVRLNFIRSDLRYSADKYCGWANNYRWLLQTCQPYGGKKRWLWQNHRGQCATLQVECTI